MMDENEYLEKLAKSDMDLEEKYIKPSSIPLPKTLDIKNETKQLGLNNSLLLNTGKQIVTQKKTKYKHYFDEGNAFGGKHKKKQTKRRYKKSKKTRKLKNTKRYYTKGGQDPYDDLELGFGITKPPGSPKPYKPPPASREEIIESHLLENQIVPPLNKPLPVNTMNTEEGKIAVYNPPPTKYDYEENPNEFGGKRKRSKKYTKKRKSNHKK